jgi:type VI secretion system secreted protein Hcp
MPADYLLEIDGIKGESHDSKHKDTIEVSSFSWGATNAGSFSAGAGGGAGKVHFNDIQFTTSVNKSSPLLMKACATGQHIKKAVLFVRKAGGDQHDYYKLTLEDLMVSSYMSGGHEGGNSLPTDQFSLNFAKIDFQYCPQKADGSLEGAIVAKYSLKESKA